MDNYIIDKSRLPQLKQGKFSTGKAFDKGTEQYRLAVLPPQTAGVATGLHGVRVTNIVRIYQGHQLVLTFSTDLLYWKRDGGKLSLDEMTDCTIDARTATRNAATHHLTTLYSTLYPFENYTRKSVYDSLQKNFNRQQ